MTREQAKRKVVNLFNLATSPEEAESRSAQMKAMQLMVEHGLTMQDLGGEIKVKVALFENLDPAPTQHRDRMATEDSPRTSSTDSSSKTENPMGEEIPDIKIFSGLSVIIAKFMSGK